MLRIPVIGLALGRIQTSEHFDFAARRWDTHQAGVRVGAGEDDRVVGAPGRSSSTAKTGFYECNRGAAGRRNCGNVASRGSEISDATAVR